MMQRLSDLEYSIVLLNARGRKLDAGSCLEVTVDSDDNALNYRLKFLKTMEVRQLSVDFFLNEVVTWWRGTDYRWVKPGNKRLVSNYHTPKILKFADGRMLTARVTAGAWVLDPDDGQRLQWIFYHPGLTPTLFMDQHHIRHFYKSQWIASGTEITFGLLLSSSGVEEFSRSPLGFLPVICFTDHADFDNLKALKAQRKVLTDTGIRVTKSFFLYHRVKELFSASMEDDEERSEYLNWEKAGHELCYHALSHVFPDNWQNLFSSFTMPPEFRPVGCYIDHATHPYNYSKTRELTGWYKHMEGKGIHLIWSYVDSGDGNIYTLNQMNPDGFTAAATLRSAREMKAMGIRRERTDNLRNLLMYYVDEKLTSMAIKLRVYPKRVFMGGDFSYALPMLKSFGRVLFRYLLNPYEYYRFFSDFRKPWWYAAFSPVIFKGINQQDTDIRVFQSVAIRDFDVAFSDMSVDHFVEEKGLCIAHTYFATIRSYHHGRWFTGTDYVIRPEAEKVMKNLGKRIGSGEIWNPVLSELEAYFRILEGLESVLDAEGNVRIKRNGTNKQVKVRMIEQ